MTLLMRDQENREEGRKEGEHESRVEIATAMLTDGMDCQIVAKYSGLSVEEVEALTSDASCVKA